MRNLLFAVSVTAGSLVLGSAHGSPIAAGGLIAGLETLGMAETVHCTPGKRHHIPTWNYQTDGCRRPARKRATQKASPEKVQKAPSAKEK